MRRLALSCLTLLAVAACSPTPEPAPTPTPTAPKPAPAGESPKSTETAAAPVPAKEIPEGECGDQGKVAADQRLANTVRWSTASEQDNFGYDVFRGDSEKGDFAKLTKDPILGAGTSDEQHKYEYRDDSINPCRTYWYYVESVSTSGTRAKFTPTFPSAPKRRAVGSPAPAPAATPAGH